MLQVPNETIPVHSDSEGVLRIGETRVRLQSILASFDAGATPEGIVQSFPTLKLGDVYAVLGYYLRHKVEVESLLEAERAEGEKTRREIQTELPQQGVRERLLKRRAERGSAV